MSYLTISKIFKNSNYFENIDANNTRIGFIVKDIFFIQEIEDILNSVENNLFSDNYVLDFYKTSMENNFINYYSRSGRVCYAKDIKLKLNLENNTLVSFNKNILNSLFCNISYDEKHNAFTILKNSTVIYLTKLELSYLDEYFYSKNKKLYYSEYLPNFNDFFELTNCLYLSLNIFDNNKK